MAGYKNSISIGIKIDDINKVKNDLQKQLDGIKGINAKIDTAQLDVSKIQSSIQTQLNSMNFTIKMGKVDVSGIDTVINKTKQATQEAQQFKNVMGKSLNIGDGAKAFDDLQKRANEIRNTVDSLAKIDFNTTKNGGVKDATITYTDNMGKLVTETMKWKQVMSEADGVVKNVFTTTNVKVSENIQQLGKLEAKVESIKSKMQGKLSTANAMGIDPTLINELKTQLNSINVNTPISKINELKTQINALGGNSSANINKLQSAINSLTTRISNIKSSKMDIINSNDITELRTAESEVNRLKQLLSEVKAGKIIDGKVISSEVMTARNSVSQLSTAINGVKANVSSLGSVFKSVFSYAIGGSVVFAGLSQLRQGLSDIKNVDDSLRDLKRVSGDVSDSVLSKFPEKANEMGISLGRTTEDAITATATFKQLGYTFKEASEYMAKNSLVLSNVGDMSASDSASSLVSILKGFKLEAKDTTQVVDVLNEAGNRFAITTKDLTEGLRIGGASLALANNDLAQSTALITTGTEVLRDSNMVANGLKTISMRIRGVKDDEGELVPKMREDLQSIANVDIKNVNGGFKSTYEIIKSLGEKWSTFSDIQKANLSEEIAGKNRANVFASLMQNYQQLDKVYQMVGQSAGSAKNEQESYMNSISGKLNTFKETVKAVWLNLGNSDGIKSLLSGSANVVGGLNNIIKTFGAMPTVIMGVVGAMTLFNTKFRESMTIYQPTSITNWIKGLEGIKTTWASVAQTATQNITSTKQNITYMNSIGENASKAKVQLAGYQGQLLLANIAQKACAVGAMALQMALSMGLSLVISYAITKVMELANAQENLKKSNEDVISSYNSTKESVASATQLLAEKKKVEEQLANTNDGTKENKDLKEKLLEVERQLAQALPNSVSGWDAQGKALATNNKLIQAQIDLKNKQLQQDSIKQLKDNTTMFDADIKSFKNMQQTLENYKKSREEVIAKNASAKASGNKLIEFSTQQAINDYNKEISAMETSVAQRRLLILQLVQTGKSYKEIADNIGETEDVVKSYTDSVSDNTQQQKQNSNQSEKVADKTKIVATAMKELNSGASISKESLQALQEAYPAMGINADNAKDSVQKLNDEISKNTADEHAKDIQKATDAYAKATQEISKCNGFIDRLNKSQAMTPAIASAISKAYPEIGDNINKVATAQEFLNQKIKEEQLAQASAYEIMQGDSEEFYQNKIASNQEYQNAYENLLSAFVSDGQKADNIDFGNYKTLNELKQGTQHQFGVAIENWLVSFVGESAKGYATDFENFRSTAEQKASVLDKLNQEIKKINANLAGAEAMKTVYEGTKQRLEWQGNDLGQSNMDKFLEESNDKAISQYKAKKEQLNGAIQEVDTKFDNFGASMKGFSGGGLGGTSDFSGTGGDSGKKAEEEAKKAHEELVKNEKETLTKITDAYDEAKNKIEDSIEEINYNEKLLGDSNDGENFTKKMELTNQKLGEQNKIVGESDKQLQALKNTTVTTEEAQKALSSEVLKASKELRNEKLEIASLNEEMKKSNEEQVKKKLETQQKLEEIQMEVKQNKEKKDLTYQIYGFTEDEWNTYKNSRKDEINQEISDLQDRTNADEDNLSAKDALIAKQHELNDLDKESYNNIKDFQSAYEEIHNQRLTAIDDELKALEKTHDAEEKENNLLEKKKALTEAQISLEKAKNDKSLYQYKKNEQTGVWDFEWVVNEENVKTAQDTYDKANKDLKDYQSDQDYETKKSELEQRKTDEDTLIKIKKDSYDKQQKILEETQATEKSTFEYHYSDMDKLVEQEMKDLSAKYGDNWKIIYETIDKNLTDVEKRYDNLAKMKAILGIDGLASSSNKATNSNTAIGTTTDVNGNVVKNTSKNDIINNNSESQVKQELQTYTDALQNKLDIMTKYATQMIKVKAGFESSILNLQNVGQKAQYDSYTTFALKYSNFSDKFLELLQLIYDFRFTNIVNLSTHMQDLIKESLLSCEEAYKKFVAMSSAMGIDVNGSIDISSALTEFEKYKQSVADWTKTKEDTYTNEKNNPLTNPTSLSDYESKYNVNANDISKNPLYDYSKRAELYNNSWASMFSSDVIAQMGRYNVNSSGMASLNSQLGTVTNNSSKSSSITNYQIDKIEMTATDDPIATFNSIVEYANQKAVLKS
ncbi:hypothetical protein psyc5s11_36560 [Clostridium gelidum]|uniref:Phage tail tape measure protein domain-containing protein n=1 Tax=Clostridium gelidum TaxID=704125 RepID=A0ABN6IZN3_9CLOT|nr:phage tail tape measure protein [Clostridium gelidum]BCZ47589.1 hypothetical protein psyc5s11_36560 [Clostridium gelidum]